MTKSTDTGGTRPRRQTYTRPDPIDVLDNTPIGGAYHHGGPYDATLAANNRDTKYSPVAAVHESNMAALKATPREYVKDSLIKHVPLQGTATIPPGEPDFNGDIMDYEDGADLMREPDAMGGAYKRWDGLTYHPDDLKGKGEPSYTFEEAEKSRHRRCKSSLDSSTGDAGSAYEMQPHPKPYSDYPSKHLSKSPSVKVRKRSVSDAPKYTPVEQEDGNSHHHSGLRRRWGSLRRKGGG
ncbi:hypothetical protein jhhlp_001016 [Lomentospora prolificans]|uniref:Pal1 cell morphology protein n=1 Tax=Lomentospora prolificans TaxID=41688 RepID=A0A2N3NK30_9PEZI|nr:hypothetical protein jhhlp_001016 [Lomentospora prolificans]